MAQCPYGHANPRANQFCGSCGSALTEPTPGPEQLAELRRQAGEDLATSAIPAAASAAILVVVWLILLAIEPDRFEAEPAGYGFVYLLWIVAFFATPTLGIRALIRRGRRNRARQSLERLGLGPDMADPHAGTGPRPGLHPDPASAWMSARPGPAGPPDRPG